MQNKRLTKCDFCKYRAGGRCTVTPNSFYCKEASDELFAYLNKNKQLTKSLRPWERKK